MLCWSALWLEGVEDSLLTVRKYVCTCLWIAGEMVKRQEGSSWKVDWPSIHPPQLLYPPLNLLCFLPSILFCSDFVLEGPHLSYGLCIISPSGPALSWNK